MNKLAKNTFANLVNRIWAMVSVYFFIPFYINFLGSEQYGLMTFFATLQATFNLLGLGLSGTLRREFATVSETLEERQKKWNLLQSTEFLYLGIMLIIIFSCLWGKDFIANSWLKNKSLSSNLVENTIVLMGISIAVQLMNNLWHGCLLGLGYQVLANGLNISWSILRSFLGVLSAFFHKSITSVYFSYLIIDVLFLLIYRIVLKKKTFLNNQKIKHWHFSDFKQMRSIIAYTFGLLEISLLSLLSNQLDKLIISRYLGLTDLGVYNTLYSLGSLVRIFPSAISIAVMTKFTRLFAAGSTTELDKIYLKIYELSAVLSISIASFVAFFSNEILRIWLGANTSFVPIVKGSSCLIVFSIAFLSLQEIPYCYLLAKANTKVNVWLSLITIPVYAVLLWVGVKHYGIKGAAFSTFSVHLIQTLVYIGIVNRNVSIKNTYLSVFFISVVSLLISLLTRMLTVKIRSDYVVVSIAILSGILTLFILCYSFFPKEIQQISHRRGLL